MGGRSKVNVTVRQGNVELEGRVDTQDLADSIVSFAGRTRASSRSSRS
jgi:osmotically-inducible protein OsmY